MNNEKYVKWVLEVANQEYPQKEEQQQFISVVTQK